MVRGPPAENHQVGARRQTGQRPARMAVDKEWTAIRLALRSAASSNAKVREAVFSRSPMPMPTCLRPDSAGSRTTTTGHGAWVAAYPLTDPRTMAANAPTPREPTTSISAPDPLAVTASAGGPSR